MLVFLLAALENDEDKKLFTEIYEQYRPQMERTAMHTITWIDAQNNIQFSIDGNFDADDILHIAESVSLVNSTK